MTIRIGSEKPLSNNQIGHGRPGVTGYVEFADGELPTLLVQSGRAGARLTREGRYLSVNRDFARMFEPKIFQASPTLMEVWEPGSLEPMLSILLQCQTHGPQMVRGCRLQHDVLERSFDILFISEPHEASILQILFEVETGTAREPENADLRRLQSIVNLAPILISIKDRQSVIRMTNRCFEVLDGPQAEDYVNRSVFDLFPREIAEQLWKNDLTVFHTGQVLQAEETVRHRDGSDHTYLTYKFPLMQFNGEVVEVCAISTDITQHKYDEEQAREAMRRAEEANRLKSDFLAHMSHEIRTPLTVIRGYADMMARSREVEPDTIRSWINSVLKASQQLERIINDILDLSKVEAGLIEIEKTSIDLHQLLNDLLQSFTLKAEEKKLQFRVEILDSVPGVIVTDGLRLRQVLDNLVSNALKFTEEGSVVLTVEREASAADSRLRIWVRDTGIGLSEEEQTKLFHPFVQADGSITRRYGGTGLGLVLARRLAQRLGGDVVMHRSAPQQGTDMFALLPIGEPGTLPLESPLPLVPCLNVTSQKLCGRRLLIVEDAEDIREFLRYFLMQQGADVETAAVGQEALLHLEKACFDVVLMDLQMPGMDGMQTMTVLRERGYQGVIVAVTAHALQGERERCLKAGFDEFLSKPIQLPQVLNLIEYMLVHKVAE